jgi:N-acetylglutamate synthase-like GNAT family acetyltransferase
MSELASDCVIRPAGADDADAIEKLYRELVNDAQICILPEQVTALAHSSSSFLLVAEVDGEICGTALLNICADVMYGTQPFGVIENVIVAASSRGQGLGRALLAHVERLALAADCTKLMLLSSRSREAAHAFFRHCGFNGETKQAFVKYRRQFATDC